MGVAGKQLKDRLLKAMRRNLHIDRSTTTST